MAIELKPWMGFFVAVSKDFIQDAEAESNVLLRAEQMGWPALHYKAPLSASGLDPVTHWGAAGMTRAREAAWLQEFFESQPASLVQAAVGYMTGDKLDVLWHTQTGEVPQGTMVVQWGPWLSSVGLTQIEDHEPVARNALLAIATIDDMEDVVHMATRLNNDPEWKRLSASGQKPATHMGTAVDMHPNLAWALPLAFPIGVGTDVVRVALVDPRGKLMWDNVEGPNVPPRAYDFDKLCQAMDLSVVLE